MIDNDDPSIPRDNLRTLTYLLGVELDERIAFFRRGTPYEQVRASDIRVFLYATEAGNSIPDVARALGISRQAVHMSAQRLRELGVVELAHGEASKRDLIMKLTAAGITARQVGRQQIKRLETEIAEVVGDDGLQILRRTLGALIAHLKTKSGSRVSIVGDRFSDSAALRPPV